MTNGNHDKSDKIEEREMKMRMKNGTEDKNEEWN